MPNTWNVAERAEDAFGPTEPAVGEEIEVSLARIADAEVIASISREVIEHGLGWIWRPGLVASEILRKDTEVIVARRRGRVLGAAIMRFLDDEAHLFLLGVRPEHQRTGIGRRLLEWLERCARTAGITTIHLQVREQNRGGRAFYRALGYEEAALLRNYYQARENAVVMIKRLGLPSASTEQEQE